MKRAHYLGVRVRPAAARSWNEEFHDWMRTNLINEAWAIATLRRPAYRIFFEQVQFFDYAGHPITIFDIDFTGYEFDVDSHPKRPFVPPDYVEPLLASVNRSSEPRNPATCTNFEELKKAHDQLKELAKEANLSILVAAQKPLDESDASPESLQEVVCLGCLKVALCRPSHKKVEVSHFYKCKECGQSVAAPPQFLSLV